MNNGVSGNGNVLNVEFSGVLGVQMHGNMNIKGEEPIIFKESSKSQFGYDQAQIELLNSPSIPWGNNGRKLVYLESNNKGILRSALNEGYSIIVMRNKFGTGVYTQTRHIEINTDDIFRALVNAEASVRRNLEVAKKVWTNNVEAKQVINGSFKAPNSISTVLTIEEIAYIAVDVCKVNNGYLPFCHGGEHKCSDECYFYWMDITRCQGVRKDQKSLELALKSKGNLILCNDFGQGIRRRSKKIRKNLNK